MACQVSLQRTKFKHNNDIMEKIRRYKCSRDFPHLNSISNVPQYS